MWWMSKWKSIYWQLLWTFVTQCASSWNDTKPLLLPWMTGLHSLDLMTEAAQKRWSHLRSLPGWGQTMNWMSTFMNKCTSSIFSWLNLEAAVYDKTMVAVAVDENVLVTLSWKKINSILIFSIAIQHVWEEIWTQTFWFWALELSTKTLKTFEHISKHLSSYSLVFIQRKSHRK